MGYLRKYLRVLFTSVSTLALCLSTAQATPRIVLLPTVPTANEPFQLRWKIKKNSGKGRIQIRIAREVDGVFLPEQSYRLRPRVRTMTLSLADGSYRVQICVAPCRATHRLSRTFLVTPIVDDDTSNAPTTPNEPTGSVPPPISPTPSPTVTPTTEPPQGTPPPNAPEGSPTPAATPSPSPTSTPQVSPTPTESGDEITSLIPGNGFGPGTPTPQVIGAPTDEGSTAEAIARWSTVPFQRVDTPLPIGVVAFHRNGIERVSFSAQGGPWIDVHAPILNPVSGVYEYTAMVDPSLFIDGQIEIRAIAYPKTAGTTRVLAGSFQSSPGAAPPRNGEYSLFLTIDKTPLGGVYVSGSGSDANGDGTLNNPYRTLARAAKQIVDQNGTADGAAIYCLAGTYPFELLFSPTSSVPAHTTFLTIRAAPGVAREDVIITEGRPKTRRIRLDHVTIVGTENGNFYTGYTDLRPTIWVSNSIIRSLNGRYADSQDQFITAALYVTDSSWLDTANGPVGAQLVRNTAISKIKSDLVSGALLVTNVVGSDIDAADSGAHPDVYQIYYASGEMDNHIVYGLSVDDFKAQGIFIASLPSGEKIQNSAFVNVLLSPIPSAFTSQINRNSHHLIFAGISMRQTLFIRAPQFTDSLFTANLLSAVALDLSKTTPQAVAEISWNHNHFVDVTSYGTYSFGDNVTTGDPKTIDFSGGNLFPQPDSPLRNRVPTPFMPSDLLGNARTTQSTIGAFE